MFTRAIILSAKVLGTMSENKFEREAREKMELVQSAGKYLAAAKRGKTINRQQPRGKHGAEHGSHSTVAKRAETRVNKYTFSFGFLLCMGFVLQHRCNFTRSLEGRVAFERSVVLLLRSIWLIIIK